MVRYLNYVVTVVPTVTELLAVIKCRAAPLAAVELL